MSHFTQLMLLLVVVILTVKAGGVLSRRLGQPAVFGELLAGLLLGPTFLDILGWPAFSDRDLHRSLRDFAEMGVLLLMFLAGLETEADQMRRVGRAALLSAVGGVVLPFFGGWALAAAFGYPPLESVFVGTVLTATSVSISVQTLMEMGRLQSREGMTILGAAVIDDVLGVLVLSLVVAVAGEGAAGGGAAAGAAGVGLVLLKMTAFFAAALLAGRAFDRLARWTTELNAQQGLLTFTLAALLLYSWAAEAVGGVAAITGAYLAGLLLSRTEHREHIENRAKVFSHALFVPLFLAGIGMEANARTIGAGIAFAVLVSLLAVASKVVGAGLGAKLGGYPSIEALRVGVGMVSRGEVALIIATIGLERRVIGPEVFSVTVLMTLATTLLTPVLLRWSFHRRGKREADPC